MQKTTLIATLGNRDLQVAASSNLPVVLYDCFDRAGTDTAKNLVIKKSNGLFLQNSKEIWDNYESLKDQVVFPMVEQYLEKAGQQLDRIVLVSTQQEPLDAQDCYYVSLFVQKKLQEQGYKVVFTPLKCSPVDFPELVNVFSSLYETYLEDQVLVGNSGGTPDMRAASYAAGFFRGIQYITIQARTGTAAKENFSAQEKLVLKHVVEKMVASFDYGGLLNLPIKEPLLQELANYAIARLALDFNRADQIAKSLDEEQLRIRPTQSILSKEREVWISAKIKFRQNAWSDFLWRLFLIQENIYVPFIESYLDGIVIFNQGSRFREWVDLLQQEPDLIDYLNQCNYLNRPLEYRRPGKVVYEHILQYILKNSDLGTQKEYSRSVELYKILDNSLRDLRNGVAHNYKGMSKELINDTLVSNARSSIDDLFSRLGEKTKVADHEFGVYDIINERILNLYYVKN